MGSSHPTAKFKMFRPLLCVPLAIALVLLQQVPTASGTFAIAGTIGGTAITLTAAQTTALAAVALLGVKLKLVGAYLLSRRGKRSAEEEEVPTIETFATLEVEDCYKRVICAASTGKVENPAGAWLSASTGTPAASAWTSSRTCSEWWGGNQFQAFQGVRFENLLSRQWIALVLY